VSSDLAVQRAAGIVLGLTALAGLGLGLRPAVRERLT